MTAKTRKIVHIDEEKCDGCGLCVPSCAEGAIRIVNGKAKLLAENLCDGLGACLGECPKGAIKIEERAAEEFDEAAVEKHLGRKPAPIHAPPPMGGCPGSMARSFKPAAAPAQAPCAAGEGRSELTHWPVQLTLLPASGPLWDGADLLLAADCAAYAMAGFHERLLKGRTLALACPKLDDAGAYVEKLGHILAHNDVRSITIARMEVPCCGGLEHIVREAMRNSGKNIPATSVVVSIRGEVLSMAPLKT